MNINFRHLDKTLIVIITISLVFSFWLMFSTFTYSQGSIMIASMAWSDFASHIPLIRSFSLGNNFPPEYPLFPGEPIRYHFLFYFLVGMMEKIGLRIDFALNIPSALGFSALLVMIYVFAKKLFSTKKVAVLSLIFFLFNGSLSFLEFFKNHPLSVNTINEIITNTSFPSFAPYGPGIVSAFWNLNIYTNQRHLAFSFTISLFIILIVISSFIKQHKVKYCILLGLLLGGLFFFHFAVFLMTVIILLFLFLLYPTSRITIFTILITTAIISLPQYLYLQSGGSNFKPSFVPGYLIFNNLNITNFIKYWFFNLGPHFVLIPAGFLLSSPKAKKILLAFLAIFIIGNALQFSPEIAGNHKFFNYFMIVGSMFSAYFLLRLWKYHQMLKPFAILLFLSLIFSGVIDFFPIFNDTKITLEDYPINKDITWIIKNTPPNSVFLNSTYLYNPASLAGRKIFLGWPYFAWSQGYNTTLRFETMKNILETNTKQLACSMLKANTIDYIEIQKVNTSDPDIPFISNLFEEQFFLVYNNSVKRLSVYSVTKTCSN